MLRCCRPAIRCINNSGGKATNLGRSAFAPGRTQRTNVRGKLSARKCADTLHVGSSSSNATTRTVDTFEDPSRLERLTNSSPTVLPDEVSNQAEATTSTTTDLSSDTRALDALLGFLSNPTPAQHHDTRHPTLNTLRSLYVSVKHRNQLRQLSTSQLSDLAALFGSLSISIPRHSHCTYIHPLVAYYTTDHTTDTRARTYWPFVRQILQDKIRLGHTLANRDCFWLMQASLANLESGGGTMGTHEVERIVNQARKQYLRIRNDSPTAAIHLPFLRALLLLRTSPAIDEFISSLSRILLRHNTQDPRLLDFMWSTLEGELSNPSSAQKEQILDALLGALRRTDCLTSTSTPHGLLFTLATSLLPSLLQGLPSPPTVSWAARQTICALRPGLPLDKRWRHLILLAKLSTGVHPLDIPTVQNETAVHWDVLTFFKYLEQEMELKMSYRPSGEADPGVRDLVRSHWTAWKNANYNGCPTAVTRAIVATFLRLSAALRDSRLKDACHRFCCNEGLYKDDFPVAFSPFSANRLITEFVVASLAINAHCWITVMALMEHSTQGSDWKVDLIPVVVHCAIRDQVSLPFGLQQSALSLLADPSWSLQQRRRLLDAALTSFYLSGSEKLEEDEGRVVAETMLAVYTGNKPSVKSRDAILRVLRALIASRNSSMVAVIVEAIYSQSPKFFWRSHVSQLLQALLHHRQYRSASSIMKILGHVSSASIRQMTTISMARGGANSLSRKVFLSYKDGRRLTARESMLRTLEFDPRHPGRFPSLSVVPKASRALHDPELVKDSIFALVHAKRILAARKLFQLTAGKLDTPARTIVGNMILHGLVHRQNIRNGRLVRSVLHITEFLASRHGFVRDRVTINILLKAVLRWRSFVDVPKVKALFDHMIRGGYPAALKFRPRGVPFSTPPTTVTTLSLPPLPPHISFVKHVRPMYKMFIKAFHLRGDRRAAAVVIGILKAEEAKERARKEELNRIVAFQKLRGREADAKKTPR